MIVGIFFTLDSRKQSYFLLLFCDCSFLPIISTLTFWRLLAESTTKFSPVYLFWALKLHKGTWGVMCCRVPPLTISPISRVSFCPTNSDFFGLGKLSGSKKADRFNSTKLWWGNTEHIISWFQDYNELFHKGFFQNTSTKNHNSVLIYLSFDMTFGAMN